MLTSRVKMILQLHPDTCSELMVMLCVIAELQVYYSYTNSQTGQSATVEKVRAHKSMSTKLIADELVQHFCLDGLC